MRLIVGLGNPGRRFSHSRHNVGFHCLDHMARKWGIKLADRRARAVLGRGEVGDLPVVLAKPRTFMNNSGEGVAYLLNRFGLSPQDLVVIHDDMDLTLGSIRIRPRGGAAGHNGIRSIIATLATQEFPRLRVGIGKVPEGLDGVEYVLGAFSPQEGQVIEGAVAVVAEAVTCLLREGIEAAMNRYNRDLTLEGDSSGEELYPRCG